jgi:aspartate carbamoyltransferase catalytic subunit
MKDVPPMSNVSHINILVYHMSISETYDNDDTYYTVRVQSERRTENDLLCLWSR